jgi:hypothetical protein
MSDCRSSAPGTDRVVCTVPFPPILAAKGCEKDTEFHDQGNFVIQVRDMLFGWLIGAEFLITVLERVLLDIFEFP